MVDVDKDKLVKYLNPEEFLVKKEVEEIDTRRDGLRNHTCQSYIVLVTHTQNLVTHRTDIGHRTPELTTYWGLCCALPKNLSTLNSTQLIEE